MHRAIVRSLIGVPVAVAIVLLVLAHDDVALRPVAARSVAWCMSVAVISAWVCARKWRKFPAPFLSGIAGALAMESFAGPYGGVLGFLVGVEVLVGLSVKDLRRREHESRRQ